MNELKHPELILSIFHVSFVRFGSDDEKQTGVAPVDDLVATIFEKAALKFRATQAFANDFRLECATFFHGNPLIVARESSLALLVAEE
jgi:hypothetical protein